MYVCTYIVIYIHMYKYMYIYIYTPFFIFLFLYISDFRGLYPRPSEQETAEAEMRRIRSKQEPEATEGFGFRGLGPRYKYLGTWKAL